MIPRALIIRGKRWRVVRRPRLYLNRDGECDYQLRQIRLRSGLTGTDLLETFLHEVLHACLPEQEPSMQHEERMIERLAPRLLEALQGLGWMP